MRLSNISSATLFAADNNFKRFLKRASSCNNYFSIPDNPFYGKVNSNGDIIYLSENYLSSLSTKDGQTVYALNFVVDAFKDFKEYKLAEEKITYDRQWLSRIGETNLYFSWAHLFFSV